MPARAAPADDAMRGFVSHLRLNGYLLGSADAALALQALRRLPMLQIMQAKGMLRSLFCRGRGEWTRFDELFDAYWLGRGVRKALPAAYSTTARKLWSSQLPQLDGGDAPSSARGGAEKQQTQTGNATETTTAKLQREGSSRRGGGQKAETESAEDKRELQECGEQLAAFLCRRESRRLIAAKRGSGIHFRRTMRKNLSTGGEPFVLMRRAQKQQTAQLSVLLDVSASMKEHFGFFLFVLKGMLSADARVEAFIFHTRLVRVSGSLSAGGGMKTLEKFSLQTQGIGGGTRIAGCIGDFMRLYGTRCLGGRHSVLIISDGYDSESGNALAQTLQTLRRRAPRVFWLSPTLASDAARLPRALSAARQHINALAQAASASDIRRLPQQWRETK